MGMSLLLPQAWRSRRRSHVHHCQTHATAPLTRLTSVLKEPLLQKREHSAGPVRMREYVPMTRHRYRQFPDTSSVRTRVWSLRAAA